ncbi:MAG TPA: hypothetical protein PKE23_05675 [Anaerolineales bacterium]|nr:hypothetical protein [Anaerolineales bacterium]
MTSLLSFIVLLPRIFLGFFIVHSIWNVKDGKSLLVKIFLSAGVGFGVSSLFSFLWIWVGLPLTVYAWVESILAILLMIWLLFQNREILRIPHVAVKQEFLWLSFLAAGALFFALNLILFGLQYPHGRPDAWINWNVVARFIYLGGSNWQATFLRQWDHPDYPLLVPMTNAITWVFLGNASTWGPIALHFVLSLFTVGLLFSFVNIFRGFKQSVLSVLIFTSLPFVVNQGMRQYSDFLVAYLILAAGGLTLMYLQTKEKRIAVLVGLVIGLAGWAKNEGLMAILSVSFVWVLLALKKEGRTGLLRYVIGLVFPVVVIVLFKIFLAPSNDLISAQESLADKIFDIERYKTIFSIAIPMLWSLGNTPISIIGLIILTALLVGRSTNRITGLWALAVIVLIQLTAYFGIFVLTPRDLAWHLNTSLDRLYLHILPLAFLLFFLWLKSPQELLSKES